MNKWCGTGRLTRDPEVRYTQGANAMAVARFTLAVDRRFKREGEQSADFIQCVAFGKIAEHVQKYWFKGMKMGAIGRIQTGSYTGKDGKKVYTTDIIIEEVEFCESKGSNSDRKQNDQLDGFLDIPDGYDEELPFK